MMHRPADMPEFSDISVGQLANMLCEICRVFGARQWCLATSGNFSARIDDAHFLITQSGKEKSALTPDELMICDMSGSARNAALKPSAEIALHRCLYRADAGIGAVLHTHSVCSTMLSRHAAAAITFSGFEMQKALEGVSSHESSIELPVFDNTQDMPALAALLDEFLTGHSTPPPGFLIRGHGLYAWGRSLEEARRHTEGLEFLLSCAWQELLAKAK